MTNVNQAPLPRLSKAPLVRASLVKRRYIKYLALPFYAWLVFMQLTRDLIAIAIGLSSCSPLFVQLSCYSGLCALQ